MLNYQRVIVFYGCFFKMSMLTDVQFIHAGNGSRCNWRRHHQTPEFTCFVPSHPANSVYNPEQIEKLRPYLGKTWKRIPSPSGPASG